MKINIIVFFPDGKQFVYEFTEEVVNLLAQQGVRYHLINTETGHGPLVLNVKRDDSDLIIRFLDETKEEFPDELVLHEEPDLVITDFFEYDNVTIQGIREDGQVYSYIPQGEEGSFDVYSEEGAVYVLAPSGFIGSEQLWLDSFYVDDSPVITGIIVVDQGNENNTSIFAKVFNASVGFGFLSTLGSNGVASGNDKGAAHVLSKIVMGTVGAGPVVGEDLVVALYDAEGNLFGTGEVTAGQYSIDIGSYGGMVTAKLIDANNDIPDYIDETARVPLDFDAPLLAVAYVGQSRVTIVNLTLLSTIASELLGVRATPGKENEIEKGVVVDEASVLKGVETEVVKERVEMVNSNVGQAHALEGDVTQEEIEFSVDTDGKLNPDVNLVGAVLSSFSGRDAKSQGGMRETIEYYKDKLIDSAYVKESEDYTELYIGKLKSEEKTEEAKKSLLEDAPDDNSRVLLAKNFEDTESISSLTISLGEETLSDRLLSREELTGMLTFKVIAPADATGVAVVINEGGSSKQADYDEDNGDWTVILEADSLKGTEDGAQKLVFTATLPGSEVMQRTVRYVSDVIDNSPTGIVLVDRKSIDEGSDTSVLLPVAAVQLVDADGGNNSAAGYRYYLSGNDANKFSVSDVGVISFKQGRVLDYETQAQYSLTVRATNNTTSLEKDFTVNLNDINETPFIVSQIADQKAVNGIAFSFDASDFFNDVDRNEELTYAANGLPSGFNIDAATGEITGIANNDITSTPVTIIVSDKENLEITQTFLFRVVSRPIVENITVSSSSNTSDTVGKPGDTLTFTIRLSESVTLNGLNSKTAATFSFGDKKVEALYSGSDNGDSYSLIFTGEDRVWTIVT